MIILVCGLPGTGKSSLGKRISEKNGFVHLRTDEIRKKIYDKPEYTDKSKETTYRAFFLIAEYLLKSNKSCILDGTFYMEKYRKSVFDLSKNTNHPLKIIECVNDEERIKRKIKERNDVSDADFSVYLKIKDLWEPIEEEHMTIRMDEFFDDKISGMKKVMDYIES